MTFQLLITVICFLALTLAPLILPSLAVAQVLPNTFTNPIDIGADPSMIYNNGYYYYLRTGGAGITIYKTESPVDIDNATAKRVWDAPANTPYCCYVWAPELHLINGRWYVYFSASDGSGYHGMYVLEATGSDPQGDYVLKPKLVAPNRIGDHALDETVFKHSDGKLYLLWSAGLTSSSPQYVFIAPMSNPWTISGNAVELIRPDYNWENSYSPIVEGPVILQRNGKTFLIYSANAYASPDYALGMLTFKSGSVLSKSNWTKSSTPVFKKTSNVFAPGHNTFTKSPDGKEDWIIYHARVTPTTGSKRTVRAQKFTWSLSGVPQFGSPVSQDIPINLPSGDSFGDLIPKNFTLTDKNGVAKSTFITGERIYPQITIQNTGYRSVYVKDGDTRSHFYSDTASTVSTSTPSDVGVYMVNGQFKGGYEKTYSAYPGALNSSVFVGDYWVKDVPGTYTSRVRLNYDKDGIDGNYDNDQAIFRYTIINASISATPIPTATPTLVIAPTTTPTPTPSSPPATFTPTPKLVTGTDLIITNLALTDALGVVKTSFKTNEAIYVKVTVKNQGSFMASSPNNMTYSVFYKNRSTTALTNQGSDPINFYMETPNLASNQSQEYGSYSTHSQVNVFKGVRSWFISTPGTYTARIFVDYDARITESSNSNNQLTVSYSVTN